MDSLTVAERSHDASIAARFHDGLMGRHSVASHCDEMTDSVQQFSAVQQTHFSYLPVKSQGLCYTWVSDTNPTLKELRKI